MLELDKDVIACPYPMKTFDWDKVWRRINTKQDAINLHKMINEELVIRFL